MNNIVKAAIIQEAPVFLNLEASVEKAISHIRSAVDMGAEIVAFPECWFPGYPVWLDFAPRAGIWDEPGAKKLFELLAKNSFAQGDKHIEALQAIVEETGVILSIGAHERDGNTLYNTSFMFQPGACMPTLHRKLMPTYTERLIWGNGDGSTLGTLSTQWGAIGTLICWEHWMPLARAAMHAKGETIHVAQWPMVKEMNLVASRHYAFEGRCTVLAAGSVMTKKEVLEGYRSTGINSAEAEAMLMSMPGEDSSLIHRGGSAIIAADGSYITEPVYDKTCIITGDIDVSLQLQESMALDTDGHYSRPDVFELSVNTRPQPGVKFEDWN